MGVEGQTDDFSMVFFYGIFQWYFSGEKKLAFEGQRIPIEKSHRKIP
jgi:hypothetical protein